MTIWVVGILVAAVVGVIYLIFTVLKQENLIPFDDSLGDPSPDDDYWGKVSTNKSEIGRQDGKKSLVPPPTSKEEGRWLNGPPGDLRPLTTPGAPKQKSRQ